MSSNKPSQVQESANSIKYIKRAKLILENDEKRSSEGFLLGMILLSRREAARFRLWLTTTTFAIVAII